LCPSGKIRLFSRSPNSGEADKYRTGVASWTTRRNNISSRIETLRDTRRCCILCPLEATHAHFRSLSFEATVLWTGWLQVSKPAVSLNRLAQGFAIVSGIPFPRVTGSRRSRTPLDP